MKLIIIESAGKVHKIQGYLGDDYKVVASLGHVIDLDESKMSVDFDDHFKPTYVITKPKIVTELKKDAKKATEIILASDDDREGEMIAWSLEYVLGVKNSKRVRYNAITKTDILNAISHPGTINMNLVDAQKARRVLDRIVGYELSPLLLKHVGPSNLSAGRVQSVVVRIIIDKEEEIKEFFKKGADNYFKFRANFNSSDNTQIKSILHELKSPNTPGPVAKINSEKKSRDLMNQFTKSIFKIANVSDRKSFRSPSPPFITSSLQQEAFRKFGFSIKQTMDCAQKLYEGGYITYMRTDSVNLSADALSNIKKFVVQTYGANYHKQTEYTTKDASAQEAHEAIRPTDSFVENLTDTKMGYDEKKLYNLIWKRAIASQMVQAEYKITTIQISISQVPDHVFITEIETLVFPGFLKVYNLQDVEDVQEQETNTTTKIPKVGETLKVNDITGTQEYSSPTTRYNQASLIAKMEAYGIGRPATYAPMVDKVISREYVKIQEEIIGEEKDSLIIAWDGKTISENTNKVTIGKEKKKFVPTFLGSMVNTFLMTNFPKIIDYKFTADMESKLDEIAQGKKTYENILSAFYKDFHEQVVKIKAMKPIIEDKFARVLGTHPDTGLEIIATVARYGPVIKMCLANKKCQYAPIQEPLKLETITLQDALKLFEYPKVLGKYQNKDVKLTKGKFGFYIIFGDKKYPVENEEVTLDQVISLIEERKPLGEFKDDKKTYIILSGPYGKYVKVTDTKSKKSYNVKLPEDVKIEELTIEKLQEIIKTYYDSLKEKRANAKFKKTAEKTTTGGVKNKTKKISKPKTDAPKKRSISKK